jgi:hypothetical protein
MVVATLGLLLTFAILWFTRREPRVITKFKFAHLAQLIAQSSIYFYTFYFIPGLRDHIPLIVFQLIFANSFYFLFTLWRINQVHLDLSMFPIVLSINLFLWFYPQYFVLHLLLIVCAILAKTYLVRTVDGKTVHIFNPSALVMAAAATIVTVFYLEHLVRSLELVDAYTQVPYILLLIFIAGCLPQWVGKVQFIALGALLGHLFSQLVTDLITDFNFPARYLLLHPSVFIGITLLVTDPVTGPRRKSSQFVFGLIYGLSIVPVGYFFYLIGAQGHFAKLMFVPVLNYFWPMVEKVVSTTAFRKAKKSQNQTQKERRNSPPIPANP